MRGAVMAGGTDHTMAYDWDPSTAALLNALLREWTGWRTAGDDDERRIVIDLPAFGGSVQVPVRGELGVGRWRLGPPLLHAGDGAARRVGAAELAMLVLGEPSLCRALGAAATTSAARTAFVARVADSERNLDAALRARHHELDAIFEHDLTFLEAEQALVLGHSVHPTPRAHACAFAEDLAPYVPSQGARVGLEWIAVSRERLRLRGAIGPGHPRSLPAPDPGIAPASDPEQVVVALHPLQVRALEGPLARAERQGHVQRLGQGPARWAPTSSMRTLARPGSDTMLKFSLPVRLTNSMRTLRVEELERGLTVTRILDDTEARMLEQEFPWFRILREPAYYGLLDEQGRGLEASFVAVRDDPFTPRETVEVLATLLQDDPRTGCSRLATRLRLAARAAGHSPVARVAAWWSTFLARVCRPIFVAQADYGLLLSAHQQNLVLGLAGGEVERVWFRDTQGTAYSPLARERFGDRVPQLADACFTPPHDRRLFAYSLVVNAVFNVIASLAMVPGVRQAWLLDPLRAELEWLRERPVRDPSCLDYLLEDPTLWAKGNFVCCLRDLDEATLEDPSDIYQARPNPLWVPPSTRPERVAMPSGSHELAGFDGDRRLELEGAEADPQGGLRQRGRLDGAELRLEQRAEGAARIHWTAAPDEGALVRLSDHVFGSMRGLDRITHVGAVEASPRVLVRALMLQGASPWHHAGTRVEAQAGGAASCARVVTNGVEHPRRAPTPPGLLYRRRCVEIDRVFSLRRFDPERDLDAFVTWMNDPVVAEFWEQAWSRERLRAYVQSRLEDPHAVPMIGCFDDVPFAYFESYWAREDRLGAHYDAGDYDRGFHMAVGDPRFRFRGYGRHWFLSVAHFLWIDEPRTQRLVGEPRVDQARVRSWADTTAWRIAKTIELPHKRAVLMTLQREDFFAEFGGPA